MTFDEDPSLNTSRTGETADAATATYPEENKIAAMRCASAGIPIFPAIVVRNTNTGRWDKRPALKGWRDLACTDVDQIARWWREHPDSVPGIELGRAGLVVIDADRHGGPDGVAALSDLIAKNGRLPPHPLVYTPGNGEHRVFRQPPGNAIGNRTGRLPAGIDVRGSGGWIVAPGSVRPDGHRWEPAIDRPTLWDGAAKLSFLPPWMAELIQGHRPTERTCDAEANGGAREERHALAALAVAAEELSLAKPGTRDNAVNALAYRFGRMIACGWISASLPADYLFRACERNGLVAENGATAVTATIARAIGDGAKVPADDLPPVRPAAESKTEAVLLSPTSLKSLLDMDLPPREFVISPLLHERGLAMVYAWRGVGKTWFALGLAYAIAAGTSFLRWKAERPRKVLHVCGEMPAVALKERLAQLVGEGPTDVPLEILSADLHETGIPDLSTEAGQNALEPTLEGVEVIIFDNVSTLFRSGEENEAGSWGGVQNWLLRLRRKGRSVVIIHHSNKSKGQRGTSKREDVLDVVVNLKQSSDYEPGLGAAFEVHFEKARGLSGSDVLNPFQASLRVENGVATWEMRDIEDARLKEILDLKEDGLSVRKIADELGMSKSAVQRAIDKAVSRTGAR